MTPPTSAAHETVEELHDAILIIETYDVVEGDIVPESDLWNVVNAARKMLDEVGPQWDKAQAALAAIRELHVPDTRLPYRCRDCLSRLPCPTLIALGDLA